MTKRENKMLVARLLTQKGIDWEFMPSGQFKVAGIYYNYRAKSYAKAGKWYRFNTHQEFVNSL